MRKTGKTTVNGIEGLSVSIKQTRDDIILNGKVVGGDIKLVATIDGPFEILNDIMSMDNADDIVIKTDSIDVVYSKKCLVNSKIKKSYSGVFAILTLIGTYRVLDGIVKYGDVTIHHLLLI